MERWEKGVEQAEVETERRGGAGEINKQLSGFYLN